MADQQKPQVGAAEARELLTRHGFVLRLSDEVCMLLLLRRHVPNNRQIKRAASMRIHQTKDCRWAFGPMQSDCLKNTTLRV